MLQSATLESPEHEFEEDDWDDDDEELAGTDEEELDLDDVGDGLEEDDDDF